MAHFAKLDENNIVLAVHVVNNDVITIDGVESEQAGVDFLTELHGHTMWKQTSYNGTIRKNYAGIGYTFDGVGFAAPQPFASWTKNAETYLWEAPTPMPSDGKVYKWDEDSLSWIEMPDEGALSQIEIPTEQLRSGDQCVFTLYRFHIQTPLKTLRAAHLPKK